MCICAGFILYILNEALRGFSRVIWPYLYLTFFLSYWLMLVPKPQTQSRGKVKIHCPTTRKASCDTHPSPGVSQCPLGVPQPCTFLTHATSLGMQLSLYLSASPTRVCSPCMQNPCFIYLCITSPWGILGTQ